jgi:SP family sugar:H+ symporter-like MFS transporter
VFVGCNLAAALIVWLFMFETKSLSLENVDAMYQEPKMKAWQSSKWVPPGYVDRLTRDEAYWQERDTTVKVDGAGAAREENLNAPPKYESDGARSA